MIENDHSWNLYILLVQCHYDHWYAIQSLARIASTIESLYHHLSTPCQYLFLQKHTTVTTARDHSVQLIRVLGHTVYTVNVTTHGTNKRLGEHTIELDCIQCTNILSSLLEGMCCWIKVALHFVNILRSFTDIVVGRA